MLKKLDEGVQDELDLLRCARDTILKRGWIQRSFLQRQGVCLLGSVMLGHRGIARHSRADWLVELLDFGTQGMLTWWNDKPGRTREEVLRRIDNAINERLTSC